MGAIKYWSVTTVYSVNFGLIIELNALGINHLDTWTDM